MNEQNVDRSRRAFLAKVAYTAPLIVTLNVMPSIASAGSPATDTTIDGVQRLQQGPQGQQGPHGHHHNKWHWS
jgi:hypothetical protein